MLNYLGSNTLESTLSKSNHAILALFTFIESKYLILNETHLFSIAIRVSNSFYDPVGIEEDIHHFLGLLFQMYDVLLPRRGATIKRKSS